MVPEGWNSQSLSEVAKVIDCKHRTPIYVEDGIPVISPGAIRWGELDLESCSKRVTHAEYQSLMDHCEVDPGDLVLSRNQSVGIAAYVRGNDPFVLGQDTVLLQPASIDSKYLFYCLQSTVVQRAISKLAGGSTFSRVNLSDIRKLKLQLPAFQEQTKIAQILSTWDEAISKVEKLIENSKQQKKALMQQLLSSDSIYAQHGQSFREIALGKLFTERRESGRDDLKLLSITSSGGVIDREEVGRKDTSNSDKSKYKRIATGDIGYNTMRMWQGVSAISDIEGIVSPAYTVVTPGDEILGAYAAYLFKLPRTIHDFYRYSQGLVSDTWNLKYRHFSEVKVHIPSIEEQQKITSILKQCDQSIENLITQRDRLEAQKKALMQQLLTGKKRVKIPEPTEG